MTWLADTVAELYHELDIDESMRVLAELTRFDRYQGSAGIGAAAELVAEQARRAGLVDVEILRLPADGRTRWWTFTAPASWTPRAASLSIAGGSRLVGYPEHPYSLAANSAGTNGAVRTLPIVEAVEPIWPRGALVLVESISSLGPDLFARLRDSAAAGFAVVTHPDRPGHVGRVELTADSGLFAFSVDPQRYADLREAARTGRRADVVVDVDTSPQYMPVVTARTASGGPRECLVTAHLCHPAPGANDNASGVTAALAVGRLLTSRPLRRAVRFVWGPEFVGLAAYLHTRGEQPGWERPLMAVNLDMVGEDQRQCGGPLIIEHCPDYLPHFVNALADAVVGALPQASRSYSGAVPCDVWAWRSTPYVGASDHGLLVDRSVGCPAIQLGHWPDRYNHSAADSLDKVDPQELRRSAAIAASVLYVACDDPDPDRAEGLAHLVSRWVAQRMVACLPSPADPVRTGASDRARRLERAHDVGVGALRSLLEIGAKPERIGVYESWLADLRASLRGDPAVHYHESVLEYVGTDHGDRPLTRAWPGPFNLRALIGRCAPDDRRRLEAQIAADRARCYATAMALAQGIDGSAHAELVIERAALDSGLRIERAFAHRFLGAMLRAGWAVHGPRHGPPPHRERRDTGDLDGFEGVGGK